MTTIINFALEDIEDAVDLLDEQESVIENELNTNARVIDTVSAMEALLETLEGKETLSLEEMRLINIAGQFGATGTDAKAEDIVPSMESLKDVSIATEGILESIQNGIASIAASNSAVMWAIEKRITGLGTIVKAQQVRIENIKKAIDGVDKTNNKASFILRMSLPVGSSIKDKATFMKSLKEDSEGLLEITKIYTNVIDDVNASFLKVMGSFRSTSKYNEFLAESFTSYNEGLIGKIISSKFFSHKNGNSSAETNNLITNKVISANNSDKKITATSKRAEIRTAIDDIGIGIFSVKQRRNLEIEKQTIEFHDFTLQDMKSIAGYLETIVEAIDLYRNKGQSFNARNREIYTVVNKISGMIKANASGVDVIKNFNGMVDSLLAQGLISKDMEPALRGMATASGLTTIGFNIALVSLSNWLRKLILAWIFTTFKLQYKITRTIAWFDHNLIDLDCATFDIGMKPLDMAAKRKSWE